MKPPTILIRLRSKDGLERVEVPADATVGDLMFAIESKLSVARGDQVLSRDQKLLLATADPDTFTDLRDPQATLTSLKFSNGEMVYLHYTGSRVVEPVVKVESRPFGSHKTVADIAARQFRLERQEKAKVENVSIDRWAANKFQEYVASALAFNIKRGGIMYGHVDESTGNVVVDAIYEPPQEATKHTLTLERGGGAEGSEESRADFLALHLGMVKVGWIFAHNPGNREHMFTDEEIAQMALWQSEIGPSCISVVVSLSEDQQVHFEAFQVSEQACKLAKEGWFQLEAGKPNEKVRLRNPTYPDDSTPIILPNGKDVGEIDSEWFVLPVPISDHEGIFTTAFPVENRLLGQSPDDLKRILKATNRSYTDKISDFHILLWLSNFLDLKTDIALLAEAVKSREAIQEGYRFIIDTLAGIN